MVTEHATLVSLLVAKVKSESEQVQVTALEVLCNLASNYENAQEMVTNLSLFVAKAESESEQVKVAALNVLCNLARNNENAREMATEHSTLLSLLVVKVGSESEQVQVAALNVLYNLVCNDENAREMVTEHATFVALLVAKVESESEQVQVKALDVLQKLAQSWNSGNKQKIITLLVARLGVDNPEQVQIALNVLQSLANKDKNAREMVIKHATLIPLLMTKLSFAASPTTTTDAVSLMFPVFSQALVDASAELDVVLKFRLLVDKVKVSAQRVIDKDALMDQNCGDGRVLEGILGLESMKLDLTQFETQLGSEPFFAPPTSQQLYWIEKRNLARSNLLSSTMRLEQAISATGAAHLAEFNALKQQLDSVCLEASKSSVIEVKQRELLQVFQVELAQGISDASPRSAVDRMTNCYLELILLCKMRTREELDNMLQQAREVLQSQGVLRWAEKRLESSNEFISQNKELQAKLERANQIIDETRKLKDQFDDLEIEIAEQNLLQAKAHKKGQAVAGIEGELATLDATRKSIIFIKGELDKEMRHLAGKQAALEENVVCYFPELFHRVALEWEATPVGQALSKADEIKALLLKSDLLLSQGVAEYAGPTARMELTMKNVQSLVVRGAVANGSGAQVVIKRVVIKDSLTEIAKTKRILRASRIAAHPSILSCLGGIVVSEQEVKLVFPYMCGGDLAFWSQEQVRPASRKVDVLTQVSDAIVALHRVNIFHRDIKPWNIVMDSSRDDAVPKLTDFDMSKETGIAQTFNTTRGLLGTTQGFRAPEVGNKPSISATDYGKQDVYSFGATAIWLLGNEPVHLALFASCTNHDANLRPTSKEVYGILSKRRCILCLDDDVAFKDCVVCPDGAHSICNGCFDGWVEDQLQTELGRRKEVVACPSCTTNQPFPIRLYAHHIDLVLRSHREKVESTVNQQVAKEVATALEKERALRVVALEKERALGVVALALRMVEDLLTSKCPQCKAAFLDFTGCCALTCASCNIQFCAFCHQGAAANAYSHVQQCVENPNKGSYFCDKAKYATQQKAFKTKILKKFLQTLGEVTQGRVRKSALGREYLSQKRMMQ
ncbi:hypothetical protein BASA81_012130 [Batrachochytrium salamandrivorans]|nr:hypothetical protein BASA81_012130 [Batrachochytrium salamandrivorans]